MYQVFNSFNTFATANRQRVCDDPIHRRCYATHLDQYKDGVRLIGGFIVLRCDGAPSGKCLEIRGDSYSISHLANDKEIVRESTLRHHAV